MMIEFHLRQLGIFKLIYIPTQFPESETIELLRLYYLMLCKLSCATILIKLQRYNFFCQQIADVGSKH